MQTDRTFTGQKQDGTGLHYYNARYYDSSLGVFLSPDTLVPDAGRVVDYNRFLYVRGNPLKYNDPDGHCSNLVSAGGPSLSECSGGGSDAVSKGIAEGVAIGRTFAPALATAVVQFFLLHADKIPGLSDWLLSSQQSGNAAQGASQGGGNTAGPGGWDPNQLEKLQDLAKTAQARIGDSRGKISPYTQREYAEATLADGSIITHSGSDAQTAAGGYARGIHAANQLAQQIGFKFPDYGFATHAEVKLAALAPNQPIAVSRPMCSVCMNFFQQLANHTGVTQVVADPVRVHTFIPK